ncbi:MAG: hypothetical protein ACOVRP_14810 [Gemmatimonas sp.]|jgi:hypothetical protein
MTIDQPTAQIVAAIIALIGVLAGLWAQNRRVHRENRKDHGETVKLVREMAGDLKEVREDVRDVKAEVRSHGDRLRSLERISVTQDATDAVVAENARKLKSAPRKRPSQKEAS